MTKSISEITKMYKQADVKDLPAFIEEFKEDERGGVQNLIQKANKRLLDLEAEKERMYNMFSYERKYGEYQYICGVDEVGCGPLAGPVVAAAVVLPKDCDILYLNDSKKLTENKREEIFDEIMEKAISVGIGFALPERIDEINIRQADFEAMRMALSKLSVEPDFIMVDGYPIGGIEKKQISIVKGDSKSASIAAASIIAKVTRDRLMTEYDEVFPGYGFASNKGYGSAEHIKALKELGPTPIHRKTFIKNFV
ncbi:MAG: ribonuclease HII [Lachnospiraceae bacterium]|nr:ribonuclease HII [Lachnospiraceae bacterium]